MEDIDFWVDFVAGNWNKFQKLGLEGKISWALKMYKLLNLESFHCENVRNKEFVHTWANRAQATLVRIGNLMAIHTRTGSLIMWEEKIIYLKEPQDIKHADWLMISNFDMVFKLVICKKCTHFV